MRWMRQAACRGMDPDLFFPSRGSKNASAAIAVCEGCPVKNECLEFAINGKERWGIWGGLQERPRRRLRVEKSVA